jgi:hypothetical protein
MKVAELTGALLDYWVARAEGMTHDAATFAVPAHAYSTEWAYGGPILGQLINQGYIFMRTDVLGPVRCLNAFGAMDGSTALESAMRAFVHGRFGAEVPDAA